MNLLPHPVAALDFCGNIGNATVADVAVGGLIRQQEKRLNKGFVAYVADVAVREKTCDDLEIRRKMSENKAPKSPNLALIRVRARGQRGNREGNAVREVTLERRLRSEIQRRGGQARKFVSPGWAGAPDRLVLMPGGRAWFVEVKRPGARPRPLQEYRAKELEALGFQVRVVSSVEELHGFLAEVDADAV